MINPGDRVICVDDRVYAEQWLGIKEGETFTVSWSGRCKDYMNGDYDGVRLAYWHPLLAKEKFLAAFAMLKEATEVRPA